MARSTAPRILIAHDWLNQKDGGGEAVLYELLRIFPQADVVTLVYNRQKFEARMAGHKVRTSWLQYLPKFIQERPMYLFPFVGSAVRRLSTKGYDLVIMNSSAWVKNMRLQPKQPGLVYCLSPARMLWDSWPAALTERTSNPVVQFLVTRWASRLRLWDYYSSQSAQLDFVAISQSIQARIAKFYHRRSAIIYPPVEQPPTPVVPKGDYYIVVSVLAAYKQIDLAIEACRQLKRKLIIVGDGPDRSRLERLATGGGEVVFAGRVSEATKHRLLAAAQAFLFCSIEDFGIAPVEAMACGTPVVALRGGGLSETVRAGKTGIFFDEPTAESLMGAMRQAEKTTWVAATIRRQAGAYSPEEFRRHIRQAAERALARRDHARR